MKQAHVNKCINSFSPSSPGCNSKIAASGTNSSGSSGEQASPEVAAGEEIRHKKPEVKATQSDEETQTETLSLVFSMELGNGLVGIPVSIQPELTIRDQSGDIISQGDASKLAIALSLAEGAGGLFGTLTANAVDGVAKFTNIGFTAAGLKQLHASVTYRGATFSKVSSSFSISTDSSLPATDSSGFLVTEPANAAHQIARGNQFTIAMSYEVPVAPSKVSLYYNSTSAGCSSGLVGWTKIVEVPTGAKQYAWSTSSLTPGTYYICGTYEKDNLVSFALSPGSLSVMSNLPFLTTWKTDNPGESENNEVKLPLVLSGTYNFTVEWGDGTVEVITRWDDPKVTHAYDNPGTYIIKISGTVNGWSFANQGDPLKILDIMQWGSLRLGNDTAYFHGAGNMTVTATDILDLSGTTDFSQMFLDCALLTTVPNMGMWDVSNVTDMGSLFTRAYLFNEDISAWNTSQVTSMGYMFHEARAFNQDIGSWDTSKVTNMVYMFYRNDSFNRDISAWNTGSVTNMAYMFFLTPIFNQNIGGWDTRNVTTMQGMFRTATAFNQNISGWNTAAVTNMSTMFQGAVAFNQPIGTWNTGEVTNMGMMLSGATSFNQPLNSWDVRKVVNMTDMFNGAAIFNQDLNQWQTLSLEQITSMFRLATSFNGDISTWDTSKVLDMQQMFNSAVNFNRNIGSWDTTNVTSMRNMFFAATQFNQNIGLWNTGKVENMGFMFQQASNFNQNIGTWNTENVTDMNSMFRSAPQFNQPIGGWNTSKVATMANMFNGATVFNQNIGSWSTGSVTSMLAMLRSTAFDQNISGWNIANVTTMAQMLQSTTAFSTANYDALLIAWSKTPPRSGVALHAGSAKRSAGIATTARAVLTGSYTWTIADGGVNTFWPTSGLLGAPTNLTSTGVTLNWSSGSDSSTLPANLEYFVCYGPSILSIDTAQECLAASPILGWTPNTLTVNVGGLTAETTYYFNVVMRDSDGNQVAYDGISVTTNE